MQSSDTKPPRRLPPREVLAKRHYPDPEVDKEMQALNERIRRGDLPEVPETMLLPKTP